MLALEIILGLILLIVVILSIKVKVIVHFEDKLELSVKYLFLNFTLIPKKEKKQDNDKSAKKKSKPKKEKKKSEDKPEAENTEISVDDTENKKDTGKKDNLFIRFYKNQGYQGVLELLTNTSKSLSGMFKKIGRSFLFEELYFSFLVSGSDSSDTAIKYGKTCSMAFPAFGYITSTMRVKKYNIEISPDFIHEKSIARFHVNTSLRPICLINAVIVMAFQMLFKVVIKLLKYGKKKPDGSNDNK